MSKPNPRHWVVENMRLHGNQGRLKRDEAELLLNRMDRKFERLSPPRIIAMIPRIGS